MTRYYSLFQRLLSRESKGEEADEEEGSIHKEISQQGESSGDTAPTWVLSHSLILTLFCSDQSWWKQRKTHSLESWCDLTSKVTMSASLILSLTLNNKHLSLSQITLTSFMLLLSFVAWSCRNVFFRGSLSENVFLIQDRLKCFRGHISFGKFWPLVRLLFWSWTLKLSRRVWDRLSQTGNVFSKILGVFSAAGWSSWGKCLMEVCYQDGHRSECHLHINWHLAHGGCC